MTGIRGELRRAEQPAVHVDGGVPDRVAGRERFRAEPALLEQYRRP